MSLGSNALLVELQEAVFLNPVLACEREMPRSRSSINVPSRDLDFLPPPSGSRAAHRSSDTRSVRRSESRGLGQRTPLPVGQLVFKGDRLAVDCGEQRHAGRRVDGFSDDHYPRLRKSDFKIRASAHPRSDVGPIGIFRGRWRFVHTSCLVPQARHQPFALTTNCFPLGATGYEKIAQGPKSSPCIPV